MEIEQPGPDTFLELYDTPDSYVGEANKVVSVTVTETGLQFSTVSAGGGTGTWYTVTGAMDGSNVTFTIPVSVTSNFLLFFERQPQMFSDDFTYVAGLGITTITYVAGHQPFNGATLHRAFVIS